MCDGPRDEFKYAYVAEDSHQNHFYFPHPLKLSPDSPSNISCNPIYFAVPNGGDVFVYPHHNGVFGERVTKRHAYVKAHSEQVIDMDLSPYEELLLTTSSDKTIKIWKIPPFNEFTRDLKEEADSIELTENVKNVRFHPTASNVAHSITTSGKIQFWDITTKKSEMEIQIDGSMPLNLSYNSCGERVLCTATDKTFKLLDLRVSDNYIVLTSPETHAITRSMRSSFINDDSVVTCGFNLDGTREVKIWDLKKSDQSISQISFPDRFGLQIPLVDPDLNLLYIALKYSGSMDIIDISSGKLRKITTYENQNPTFGITMLPKSALNTLQFEIARFLRVTNKNVLSMKSICPQEKFSEKYHEHLYPKTSLGNIAPNDENDFFKLKGKKLKQSDEISLDPSERKKNEFLMKHGAKQVSTEGRVVRENFEDMDKDELMRKVKTIQEKMDVLEKTISELPELRQGDRLIKKYFQKQINSSLDAADGKSGTGYTEFQVEYLRKNLANVKDKNEKKVGRLKTKIEKLKKEKRVEKEKYRFLLKKKLKNDENVEVGKRDDFFHKDELELKVAVMLRNMKSLEERNRKIQVYYEEKIMQMKMEKQGVKISTQEINEFLRALEEEEKDDEKVCQLHQDLLDQIVEIEKKSGEFQREVLAFKQKSSEMNEKHEKDLDALTKKTKKRIKDLVNQLEDVSGELDKSQELVRQKEAVIVKTSKELADVRKSEKELREKNEKMEESYEKKIDELDEKLEKSEEKVDSLEEKIDSLDLKQDEMETKNKNLKTELDTKDQKYEGLKDKFRTLRDEYRKAKAMAEEKAKAQTNKSGEQEKASTVLKKKNVELIASVELLEGKNKDMKRKMNEKVEKLKKEFSKQLTEQKEKNKAAIKKLKAQMSTLTPVVAVAPVAKKKKKEARVKESKDAAKEAPKEKRVIVIKKKKPEKVKEQKKPEKVKEPSDPNVINPIDFSSAEEDSYEDRRKREKEEREQKLKLQEAQRKRDELVRKEKEAKKKREEEKKKKEEEEKRKREEAEKKLEMPTNKADFRLQIRKTEEKEKVMVNYIKKTKKECLKNLKEKKDGWKELEKGFLKSIKESENALKVLKNEKKELRKGLRTLEKKEKEDSDDEEVEKELREIERKKRDRAKRDREKKKRQVEDRKKREEEKKIAEKEKKMKAELKRIIGTNEKREKKLKSRIADNNKKLEKLSKRKKKKDKEKKKEEELKTENEGLEDEMKQLLNEKKDSQEKFEKILEGEKKRRERDRDRKKMSRGKRRGNAKVGRKRSFDKNEKKRKPVHKMSQSLAPKMIRKSRSALEKLNRYNAELEKRKKYSSGDVGSYSTMSREEIGDLITKTNDDMRKIKDLLKDIKMDIRRFNTEKPEGYEDKNKELVRKSNEFKQEFRTLDSRKKELKEWRSKAVAGGGARDRLKNRRNRGRKKKDDKVAKFLKSKKKDDDDEDDEEIEKELKMLERKKRERERARKMREKKRKRGKK